MEVVISNALINRKQALKLSLSNQEPCYYLSFDLK